MIEPGLVCTLCGDTIFFAIGKVVTIAGTISFIGLPDGRQRVTCDALGPEVVVHECEAAFAVVAQAEAILLEA